MMIKSALKISTLLIISIYVFFPYYLLGVANFSLKNYGVEITTLDINYPSFKGVFIPKIDFSYQGKKINAKNISISYLWQRLLPTDLKISVDKMNYVDTVNNTASLNLAKLCWLPKKIKKINIGKAIVNNRMINDIIFTKDSKKIRFSGNINEPIAMVLSGACNQNKINADLLLTQNDLIVQAKTDLVINDDSLDINAELLANEIKSKIKANYNFLGKKTKVRIKVDSVVLSKLKPLLDVYTNALEKLNLSSGVLSADITFTVDNKLFKNNQHLQNKDFPKVYYNFEIKDAIGSYEKYKFNNAKIAINGIYSDGLFANGRLKIGSSDGIIKLNDIDANIDIKQENGQIQIKLSNVGVKLLGGSAYMNEVDIKYPNINIKSQLAFQDIDLETIIQEFNLESVIKISGIVRGNFDVEYSNAKYINFSGQLSNQNEGNIMYPNNINFLTFLKNLHYKKIKILSKFSKNILKIDIVELQGNDNLNANTLYTIKKDKPVSIKFKVNF